MSDHMHQGTFECKYCHEVIELIYREFILMRESLKMQYFESCCIFCANQEGFTIVSDPAMKDILEGLSDIAGQDPIRLVAPSSFFNEHPISPEDLEPDITDTTLPHGSRRTDVDDKQFYRGIMQGIRDLRNKNVKETLTPSQPLENPCTSNEESEHRFPLRSTWQPSEVPDSIEAYRKQKFAEIDEMAKYKLNPDGTFSKNEENK